MALKRHVAVFDDQVEVLATMDIGQMWDRMLGEFLAEWEQLDRQKLSAAEIEKQIGSFIDDLSEKPMERLARQSSSVSYNQGRAAEILTAADHGEVKFVIRSEILDPSTCVECHALDLFVADVGSADFYQYQPPAYCLGGRNCRGFYVAVAEGSA